MKTVYYYWKNPSVLLSYYLDKNNDSFYLLSEGIWRGLSLSQCTCRVSVVFASCDSFPLDLSHLISPFSWYPFSYIHRWSHLNVLFQLASSPSPQVSSCETHQLDSSSSLNNALYHHGDFSFYMTASFQPIPPHYIRSRAAASCLAGSDRFHGDSLK